MALTLNDSASVKKAATGPNPQTNTGPAQAAKNTTQYPATQPGGTYVPPAATGGPGNNQPVTSPGPTQAPAAAAPTVPVFDYSTDPILQQIIAQQNLAVSQAQASALAQQKASLIAYGDATLAMSLLNDPTTAAAAQANTDAGTSTLGQLLAQNKANVRGINETENKSNLYYSSDAGYQLGLAQQSYLQNQANAANTEQGALGSIGTNLLAQKQASASAVSQGENDAYGRALAAWQAQQTAAAQAAQTAAAQKAAQAAAQAQAQQAAVPTVAELTSGVPAASGDINQASLSQYLATQVGKQMQAAVKANPASAGSSGSAAVLTGQLKKNYQAAKQL